MRGIAWEHSGVHGVSQSAREYYGVSWSAWSTWSSRSTVKYRGVPWRIVEYVEHTEYRGGRGVPQSTWEYVESAECRGVPRSVVEYQGVLRITWIAQST